MFGKLKEFWRDSIYMTLSFLITYVGQGLVRLILRTCQWEVEGLEEFKRLATSEKCLLMLWHNRLALTPFILYRYAHHFTYAAVVSNSRDGQLIGRVVQSYRTGKTIRVSHQARHQALKEIIACLDKKEAIVIITPDGPRGPIYKVKPGSALAALQTEAYVIPLTWEADRYWTFKTWDQLRLPKPFAKIKVTFGGFLHFSQPSETSLSQAQDILQRTMDLYR
jgi:hypothetical protein